MATMNVSLPDQMKAWVEEQTHTGKFGNASDYVRDLIRRDQERQSGIARLQRLIDDGFESGVSPRSIEEILADAMGQAARGGV
jgi:antitoxin ParD1/3/4